MAGGHTDLTGRLDPLHKRVVLLCWLAATAFVFVSLELVRLHSLHELTDNGFTWWKSMGFYVHVIPGQLLSIASVQSQLMVVGSAILAGLTAFFFCLAVALLNMHLPFRLARSAILLACILAPLAWFFVYGTIQAPPRLTLDLNQQVITAVPGNLSLGLSRVAQFSTYETPDQGISVITTEGKQIDLFPFPALLGHDTAPDSQRLVQILQAFLSNGGQQFSTN